MKKIISAILSLIMIFSAVNTFAENSTSDLPDILKVINKNYEKSISEAIENSAFSKDEIDEDNIYIIEKYNSLIFEGGTDYNQYYVALPSSETEHIRFASFYKGEYSTEGMNTLSWRDMVETHKNTKIEEYIEANSLENVTMAVNTVLYISGSTTSRGSVNLYRVETADDTYYIPYYIDGTFNPANEQNCSLELTKSYNKSEFTDILKNERASYSAYLEAQKAAEEEREVEEARKEEEKYTPVMYIGENGEEWAKINGTDLADVLNDLTDAIDLMNFASTIEIRVNSDKNNYLSNYFCNNNNDINIYEVTNFAKGLFDEIITQVAPGKPQFDKEASYCKFSLKHDEGYKSIKHRVEFFIWDDGLKIIINHDKELELKVKNADAIIDYINKYGNNAFEGFEFEKNDENTPHIKENIVGFTLTDVIEFDFKNPSNSDKGILDEIASSQTTVTGKFEKYKENKYRSTYILTLAGNLGTASLCTQVQSSLDGTAEIYSNNIPLHFLNEIRFENGNVVEYKIGKSSASYDFKMIFQNNDIYEVYFNDIKCDNLKYTQLTEDTKLSEQYIEKNKEDFLKELEKEEKESDKTKENSSEKTEEDANLQTATDNLTYADTLYKIGLFKGTDKGYELEKSLTREESATILVRLLGEEDKVSADDFEEVFTDVDKDRWSYAYVMYCYKNNITKGTDIDTFSPDKQIDANQFVTLMMRLLGYIDVEPDTALLKSVEYNLISDETVDKLTKSESFTRGDMVQIVYNSLKVQMNDKTEFSLYLYEKGILTEKEMEHIK